MGLEESQLFVIFIFNLLLRYRYKWIHKLAERRGAHGTTLFEVAAI